MPAPGCDASTSEPSRVDPPVTFEDFYTAEYAAAVRLAFGMTGRTGLAEELAQDAFLAAYRKWDALVAYDNPSAWLRRVVMNRSVSLWRRGLTEARLVARLKRERVVHVTLGEADASVWDAIQELPTRQRQVVVLAVLEDHSVATVAAILQCSEESIRTHLRRARVRLAEALNVKDESDEP